MANSVKIDTSQDYLSHPSWIEAREQFDRIHANSSEQHKAAELERLTAKFLDGFQFEQAKREAIAAGLGSKTCPVVRCIHPDPAATKHGYMILNIEDYDRSLHALYLEPVA